MNKINNELKLARQLYHPTKKTEELVIKIANLFDKPINNNVKVTDVSFKENYLNIGDLSVKTIERENSHSMILIHWFPNHNISTKKDPFCSAFVLKTNELKKIYTEVERFFNSLQQ